MFYALFTLLKYLLNAIDLAWMTLLLWLCSFLPESLNQYYYFPLFRIWSRFFVRALGVELRLHQKNLKPLPKHYVLIANHPAAFEDVGIPALFPVHSLAKIEVGDWFLVGRISKASGTLYVKRDSKESRKAALESMVDAVNSGKNIALYPEGGCTGRRLNERFLNGAFEVSMRTGVPIVPVFLHYEAQEDFEWQDPFTLPQKLWHMMITRNPRANYLVFDAIDPSEFKDVEEYKQAVYAKYKAWNERYLVE
jgi:1-acyl-sn-glycerol-3-phosphate acyltransferase